MGTLACRAPVLCLAAEGGWLFSCSVPEPAPVFGADPAGKVAVWDVDAQSSAGGLAGPRSAVACLAASAGRLYSAHRDGTVALWGAPDQLEARVGLDGVLR